MYRRNLIAVTAASFIGFTGFTLVMPFLPLYIASLGVTDVGQVAMWTGVSLGVTPAITALLAPVWGRLADRLGRKLLVVRSLVSFVVLMGAMAYVTEPWHVLALRAIQGLFAGYGALCIAMAADSAPPGRIAQAIGTVQTAQRLGPALGPVLGGVVAGLVGLRTAFLVTAGFYVVALVSMVVLYREPAVVHEPGGAQPGRTTVRHVLAFENFVLLLAVTFGLQFVDRSFGPVLPLHVGALGVSEARVPFVAGIVFSVMAIAAAAGHHWCARLLQRMPASQVIGRAALGAALSVGLLAVLDHAWALAGAAAAFGLGVGVATTATYTAAAGVMPAHARATGFGVMTSASLAGVALSPIISGFVATSSIRLVFVGDALMLCVLALLVPRVMLERPEAAAAPMREDA